MKALTTVSTGTCHPTTASPRHHSWELDLWVSAAAACQVPRAGDTWHCLAPAGRSIGTALLLPVLDLLQMFSKLWSREVVPRGFHQCQLCQLFYVCGSFTLLYSSTPKQ